MKRLLFSLLSLFSLTLSMSAAIDGKFKYSYPEDKDLPYNLGYQYSVYDLKESDIEGWRVMYLNEPVTLNYNIISEEDQTVEVVFDPSYMELTDIVIPEKVTDSDTKKEYTVTAIGKMAFDDCPKIRSVIMGNSITRIEDYAFNMCDNKILHNIGFIKFSENLTHIGNYAFKNCHNLTNGHYTEGDQYPIVKLNFLHNVDYPIYGYAGRLTGVDDYLLFPDSLKYIGKHAFEGCYFEREDNHLNYGLCKVKIPNPSCVIDDYAFAGCKFLELITIGEELTCDGLTNPTPAISSKGRIGDYAFADCNLMRLDIPSSIESIGANAFVNCFNKLREKTPRTTEGRVYFDALNWFFPRSLFDNEADQWHSWNFGSTEADSKTEKNFQEKYQKYLDRWHTNTVTIHSDKTDIGMNAFANNPRLENVIILGAAGEIGFRAFYNCTNLKSVTLPDDLTQISNSMFMNCSALDKIVIPNSVTEIGDSAFYKCELLVTVDLPSNLKKVNPYTFYGCKLLELTELPDEVSSIGNHAFYGCKGLTSFTIPDKVKTIGEYAFAECYIHESRRRPDGFVTFYGMTHVKIGDSVETIGAHAFDGCRHLGTIEMGANVTEIGDYAFLNCMSCPKEGCDAENVELTLPDSLTKMGIGAFQGCTYLPGINLGNDMTELPDFAFAYCSSLSSIGNIDNIKSAKENTFLGCYSLEDFGNLFADGKNLVDGIIYNDDFSEVISALPNITYAEIDNRVTRIGDGAFANCGALEYVCFPEALKEIGSRAFADCSVLWQDEGYVAFPEALDKVGSHAFENCVSLSSAYLTNIEMGDSVYAGCTNIELVQLSSDFTQDLRDNWFAGCLNMSSIEVDPDNPIYSSDEDCTLLLSKDGTILLRAPSGLSEIFIPESVITIGDYACSNCILLYYVEIPSTVRHIGAHAFENCFEVYNEIYYSGLESVYLDNPAITIGEYAFNNCKNLSCVDWDGVAEPGDTGSIGAYAFNGCESLNPHSYGFYFNIEDATVSTLEPYAFANFPGFEEIELPATLTTIGNHAFDNCSNLKSVVFPESLKKIGNSAFKSCALTTLYLPDNIEEIGDSAFMDCSRVMDLKIPENLKKINPYTFYRCFSGEQFDKKPEDNFNLSLEIPNGVESIGDYAFYGCTVNSNRQTGSGGNVYSNLYYFYYYGLSSLSIGDNVKTIGAHAFDGCNHLLEVKMGNAVTSIGDYAFNDCFKETFKGVREVEYTLTGHIEKELDSYPVIWELNEYEPQSISLPEGLTSLGEGAFRGCVELPSINFPGLLTAIPDQAFNGCKRIQEIKLPEGLLTIGEGAFGGCKDVAEIHIPASLEKGNRVFVDCDTAFQVYYYAEVPKAFDEGFFSPKVYSNKQAVVYTPNAEIMDVKMINPWALFHTIVASDETLVHTEDVLETKNNLRFRVLSNKPHPYCEVARPDYGHTEDSSFDIPEWVLNIDPESPYFGESYKVIRIGNDAFENDQFLTGIIIPESVFDIGQEAFNNCKNLASIDLPKTISNIGERAFANCYGLTYFEVPPLVTRLNPEVLRDCRGLHSIKMHKDFEELGMGSLMDCRHLRAIEGAENWKLRLIEDYALKNCIELEDINIPEGVEKIGKEAMYYCQKLNTVSLPLTLQQLGENTFDDCEVLHTIKVYTETPPETKGERNLTDQSCKIYVQAKCLDDYKEFWKVHVHRIEPGIVITQPTRKEMPEYVIGNTYRISSSMPLEGQTMTWSSYNPNVAKEPGRHDGTMELKAVGRAAIHVETDQRFYHDCTLDVYPKLADANWDGHFDISDAVNIANYALLNPEVLINWWKTYRTDFKNESEWNEFYYLGADVNDDGGISVADASAAIKIILNAPKQPSSPSFAASTAASENHADALIINLTPLASAGAFLFPVGLENSVEYVALQADITVPEGMILKDVKAGPRATEHTLTTRRIDDRTMRIVLFDINNSAFDKSGEPLFYLTVEGDNVSADDIAISSIYASDSTSKSFELVSRTGGLYSDIATVPTADFTIASTGEGIVIGNAAGCSVAVYTVDGRTITSFVAASDSETISLSSGIYIVTVGGNAKKISVN